MTARDYKNNLKDHIMIEMVRVMVDMPDKQFSDLLDNFPFSNPVDAWIDDFNVHAGICGQKSKNDVNTDEPESYAQFMGH